MKPKPQMKVRIAKYLASCGLGSRRKCEELVSAGRVSVNGVQINTPATGVEDGNTVMVDGKEVRPMTLVYYLLNKPAGYTSTVADAHAKRLITELVPAKPPVWPVGRLDRETSGLIIMTNDGELTQRLTHPSFAKSKTYIATVDRPLSDRQLHELAGGIVLEDGPVRPDKLKPLTGGNYEVTIHEGRNRLVRRMFEHFDRRVMSLDRTTMGSLTAGKLQPGEYRELTTAEIERLKDA